MTFLVNIFVLTLAWTSIQCSKERDKVFFLQKSSGGDNETLLVVTWMESDAEIPAGCETFNDKDLINEVLRYSNDSPIRTLSEDEMKNVLGDCTEFSLRRRRESGDDTTTPISLEDIQDEPKELRGRGNRRTGSSAQGNGDVRRRPQDRRQGSSDVERKPQRNRDVRKESQNSTRENEEVDVESDEDREIPKEQAGRKPNGLDTTTESPTTMGYDGWPVIFPGTKWCGAGDIAKGYDDLGLHQDTDRCCRAHDLCNDTLAPGETRNNLKNKSPFTKLSCKCDHDFYDCLDRINSLTSNTIGNMYFNVLKRECYKEDYPLTKKCKKYRTILKLKCIEYERNTKAPKEIQWIPAKKYKKIPFPGPLTITLPF